MRGDLPPGTAAAAAESSGRWQFAIKRQLKQEIGRLHIPIEADGEKE